MKKTIVLTILIIFILLLSAPTAKATLNFETTNLGPYTIGQTFEVEFTNSIFTNNETTDVSITFNSTIFEFISSSDPNLVLTKNNSSVSMKLDNNYSAKLTFKVLASPASIDDASLKIVSKDDGIDNTFMIKCTVVDSVQTSNTKTVTTTETSAVTNTVTTAMPSTGSLNSIIPIILLIILLTIFYIYKRYKKLY